ncbi:hypothetical protein GCM10010124_11240 [Pilimelia terevasa]|uniref:PNPLA domain-containing protein n=1 Tax=Pilimelia terevasa TaxID=53372 RepID=A0A8J3BK75_9ACTN|nr:hypothetical protein [Pilimelia terevasa]GGK20381.1 hypothetical protein GCM10010124_11240 [Pilimelia terevasa]
MYSWRRLRSDSGSGWKGRLADFLRRRPPIPCVGDEAGTAWRRSWNVAPGRHFGGTAIALSGGGIRSAAFSLGAIDALRSKGFWAEARYLFCVSGGGYAAGGIQLATTGAAEAGASAATASDAFAPGSPEFDHFRRNSKYLADGFLGWLKALGVILRGLLAAQFALFLLTTVAAYLIALGYRGVRVAHHSVPAGELGTVLHATAAWRWSIVLAGLWLYFSLATFLLENWPGRLHRVRAWLRVGYLGAGGAFVAYTVLVIALPRLAELLWKLPAGVQKGPIDELLPDPLLVSSGTAATGYVATLAAILTAVGKPTARAIQKRDRLAQVAKRLPVTVLRWVMVLVGVVALVGWHLVWFLYLIAVVGSTGCRSHVHPRTEPCEFTMPPWPDWRLVAGVTGLLVLIWWIDQTRWGLHLFYKRRLARAFAVRRSDGVAREIDFGVCTRLDTFGKPTAGGPQPIWIGAAHISGPEYAPPGRRTVSYSMSHDFVGSPQLGWLETAPLCERAKGRPLQWDLTVESAMAVSGAAFASAMGAVRSPFTLLFALTNARLGAWLPNPRYCSHPQPCPLCRLPRSRTMKLLLAEILGLYPTDRRLLFVTDGGHNENLGLVEALRHAPAKLFCIDASGGATLSRAALGPAIALARQELGVDITFDAGSANRVDDPTSLEQPSPHKEDGQAGEEYSADRTNPSRIMTSAVLRATITYPDDRPPQAPATGVLYFGRALLTEDSPWSVLAYASGNPAFPNDSTADQWFDADQFDAYHILGRHVGGALATLAHARPNG